MGEIWDFSAFFRENMGDLWEIFSGIIQECRTHQARTKMFCTIDEGMNEFKGYNDPISTCFSDMTARKVLSFCRRILNVHIE